MFINVILSGDNSVGHRHRSMHFPEGRGLLGLKAVIRINPEKKETIMGKILNFLINFPIREKVVHTVERQMKVGESWVYTVQLHRWTEYTIEAASSEPLAKLTCTLTDCKSGAQLQSLNGSKSFFSIMPESDTPYGVSLTLKSTHKHEQPAKVMLAIATTYIPPSAWVL